MIARYHAPLAAFSAVFAWRSTPEDAKKARCDSAVRRMPVLLPGGGVWPACLKRGSGPGELECGSVTNAQGLRLATYTVRATNPIAVCVLVHGYRECARFEWLAPTAPGGPHVRWDGCVVERLVAGGVSCYCLDNQAHGDSEGPHGSPEDVGPCVDDVDDMARDALQIAASARAEEGAAPLFLFGSSLGGAVVARAAQMDAAEDLVDGVVLQSPMLYATGVWRRVAARVLYQLPLLAVLARVAPTWETTVGNAPNLLGTDRDECRSEPAFYQGRLRAASLRAFCWTMHGFHAAGGMENFRGDPALLCLHAVPDLKCPLEGTEALFERANVDRRTLAVFAGVGAEPGTPGVLRESPAATPASDLFTPAILALPVFHNLVREPGGAPIAAAVARWVAREARRIRDARKGPAAN